jgi:hypothetical protein
VPHRFRALLLALLAGTAWGRTPAEINARFWNLQDAGWKSFSVRARFPGVRLDSASAPGAVPERFSPWIAWERGGSAQVRLDTAAHDTAQSSPLAFLALGYQNGAREFIRQWLAFVEGPLIRDTIAAPRIAARGDALEIRLKTKDGARILRVDETSGMVVIETRSRGKNPSRATFTLDTAAGRRVPVRIVEEGLEANSLRRVLTYEYRDGSPLPSGGTVGLFRGSEGSALRIVLEDPRVAR